MMLLGNGAVINRLKRCPAKLKAEQNKFLTKIYNIWKNRRIDRLDFAPLEPVCLIYLLWHENQCAGASCNPSVYCRLYVFKHMFSMRGNCRDWFENCRLSFDDRAHNICLLSLSTQRVYKRLLVGGVGSVTAHWTLLNQHPTHKTGTTWILNNQPHINTAGNFLHYLQGRFHSTVLLWIFGYKSSRP